MFRTQSRAPHVPVPARYVRRLLEIDPDMRKRRAQIHAATEIMIARGAAFKRVAAKKVPVTIPVVVHVVYKSAAENISAVQTHTRIDALNRDYSAVNPDKANAPAVWQGLILDSQVRFALATKDPSGKTTDGITRKGIVDVEPSSTL